MSLRPLRRNNPELEMYDRPDVPVAVALAFLWERYVIAFAARYEEDVGKDGTENEYGAVDNPCVGHAFGPSGGRLGD